MRNKGQDHAHMNSMATLSLKALPMNIGVKLRIMVEVRIPSYITKRKLLIKYMSFIIYGQVLWCTRLFVPHDYVEIVEED